MPLVKEKVLDKNSSSLSAETFLFRATTAGRPLWRLHGVRLLLLCLGKPEKQLVRRTTKMPTAYKQEPQGLLHNEAPGEAPGEGEAWQPTATFLPLAGQVFLSAWGRGRAREPLREEDGRGQDRGERREEANVAGKDTPSSWDPQCCPVFPHSVCPTFS